MSDVPLPCEHAAAKNLINGTVLLGDCVGASRTEIYASVILHFCYLFGVCMCAVDCAGDFFGWTQIATGAWLTVKGRDFSVCVHVPERQ